MFVASCKRPRTVHTALVTCLSALLVGCTGTAKVRTVRLSDLEAAPPLRPETRRYVVSDPSALAPLYTPLGRRLGLLQVRNLQEWKQLSAAVPYLGPCPDLTRGTVVGLVSPAGTTLDGYWPFLWDDIRIWQGAGLIEARFVGGNYLADGLTYLETAYLRDLEAVLVVSVDGLDYLPEARIDNDIGPGN